MTQFSTESVYMVFSFIQIGFKMKMWRYYEEENEKIFEENIFKFQGNAICF